MHDVRLAAADAFADLREKVDGGEGKDRDVLPHLADREVCTSWLRKLVCCRWVPTSRRWTLCRCSRGT